MKHLSCPALLSIFHTSRVLSVDDFEAKRANHRRAVDQARANRVQHSLNGNSSKEVVVIKPPTSKKPKGERKKKTKEQKSEKRKSTKKQLQRQRDMLNKGKETGLTKEDIQSLGTIMTGRGTFNLQSLGEQAGAFLGKHAGRIAGELTGFGDYGYSAPKEIDDIKRNTVVMNSDVPVMHNTSNGAIQLTRTELIGEITMNNLFAPKMYSIDPADPRTFPWLSKMAPLYQQYEFVGLAFCFKSTTSNATSQPTPAMGELAGGVQYDVTLPAPTSIEDLVQNTFSSVAAPTRDQIFPVECAKSQTLMWPLKIQEPGLSIDVPQFYRVGNFFIGSKGAPVDYDGAGLLYIMYDVRFYKTRMPRNIYGRLFDMDLLCNSTSRPLNPVPDTPTLHQPRINALGIVINADTHLITFPLTTDVGACFEVKLIIHGTSLGANLKPLPLGLQGGMTHIEVIGSQTTSSVLFPLNSTNSGGYDIISIIYCMYDGSGTDVLPPAVGVNVGFGGSYPGGAVGSLLVSRIPPEMANGITYKAPATYTRGDFFRYICGANNGGLVHTPPPPTRARLVDWVNFFSIRAEYVIGSPHPTSSSPFDMTLPDAISKMSHYALDNLGAPTVIKKKIVVSYECKEEKCGCRRVVCNVCHVEQCGLDGAVACPCELSEYTLVSRSQLNGNNGSATNTDDVERLSEQQVNLIRSATPPAPGGLYCPVHSILEEPFSSCELKGIDGFLPVNPRGLMVNGRHYDEMLNARHAAGWKIPQLAPVCLSGKNGRYWFCDMAPVKNQKWLQSLVRMDGGWTVSTFLRARCAAFTGEQCNHDRCADPTATRVDPGDGKVSVGLCGAGSHKGDGPSFTFCPNGSLCDRARHFHKPARGSMAKVGAAQRTAKRKRKKAWVLCEDDNGVRSAVNCPSGAFHAHEAKVTWGDLSDEEDELTDDEPVMQSFLEGSLIKVAPFGPATRAKYALKIAGRSSESEPVFQLSKVGEPAPPPVNVERTVFNVELPEQKSDSIDSSSESSSSCSSSSAEDLSDQSDSSVEDEDEAKHNPPDSPSDDQMPDLETDSDSSSDRDEFIEPVVKGDGKVSDASVNLNEFNYRIASARRAGFVRSLCTAHRRLAAYRTQLAQVTRNGGNLEFALASAGMYAPPPPLPPFEWIGYPDNPKFKLEGRVIFSIDAITSSLPWLTRFFRTVKSYVPFFHKELAFAMNNPSLNAYSESDSKMSSMSIAYSFGLTGPSKDLFSVDLDAGRRHLTAYGFLSCSYEPIFVELFETLRHGKGLVDKEQVVKLNYSALVSHDSSGERVVRRAFIERAQKVLDELPFIQSYRELSVQIVQNTLHYYVQQKLVQGSQNASALPKSNQVVFSTRGPSLPCPKIGAPSGLESSLVESTKNSSIMVSS